MALGIVGASRAREERFHALGDYQISRRIGRGGMAEVFLALQQGIGGFEKLVVIKRIFKHFCEDEKFVQMFLDEARLAASIRHASVVEILDIDKDEHGYFIVMEYLSGENLAYVWEELRERDELMPVELACRVGAELAAGLHSAHLATDVEGCPQPIVHRDVTPSNLILCYSGAVKLVDFGVAKASADNKQTRPGTLKGKLEYLAPEQVNHDRVSPRTDVFQLGIVLHELFTGCRLFEAESDHKILTAVLERPIPPPSKLRPELPPAVDELVLAALERDTEKRTHSADALRRQLEAVMGDVDEESSQRALGEWLVAAFPERHAERLAVENECVVNVRKGRNSSEIPAVLAPFAPTAPVVYDAERATAATVAERPVGNGRSSVTKRRRRRRTSWFGIAAAGVVASGLAVFFWLRSPAATDGHITASEASASDSAVEFLVGADLDAGVAQVTHSADAVVAAVAKLPPDASVPQTMLTYTAQLETTPSSAEILFNGKFAGRGRLSMTLPRDGTTHRISVRAPGYRSESIVFRDHAPPREIVLEALTADKRPGRVRGTRPPRRDTRPQSGVESPVKHGGTHDGKAALRPDAGGRAPRGPATDNRNPWAR